MTASDPSREEQSVSNQRALRTALGHFATGIAIVTAADRDGALIGLTVNSFNSVSLDPPLVLFSVDRRAYSLEALRAASAFAINILSEQQEVISNQFARPLANKWRGIAYTVGEAGAPLIDGAIAQFECRLHAEHDGGDHLIFVGKVLGFRYDPAARPLLYFRGKYTYLRPDIEREPTWPLAGEY
jgi:flavin reductase (DIM6/NTAB) family NADH-FMN oxidoreductase RutF